MLSGSGVTLLDRTAVARVVALGEVAEISCWYEQIRVVVTADGPGGRAVQVTGELASGTAAYLDAVLEYQVAARPARLVVDLSEVSFLGVRGVAALARAAERARHRSLPLSVVVGDRPDLSRVLHRTLGAGASALLQGPCRVAPQVRSHVLEPHLGSPRRARVLLRRACLDWRLGNAYDDAALVVTELVTNAVRHAGTPCRLTVTLDGDGLRLAVRDGGALTTALLDAQDLRHGGAGLRVVTTLAQHWGVIPHGDGKTVWARFPPRSVVSVRRAPPLVDV